MMSITPFHITVRAARTYAILDLVGEISAQADAPLQQAYQAALAQKPAALILNFSAVDYMNSTGIALIVGLLAQARKVHLPLRVYGLNEHYQEIFQITRLADFMQLFDSEANAIK